MPTRFALLRQTDKQYYMNQQRTQSAREYDTNVLKPFREVLNDPAPKKLIIVHLLGTHIKYKYRYPKIRASLMAIRSCSCRIKRGRAGVI